MDTTVAQVNEVTQIRRILARIAIANDEIDDQERLVIVSNIGGASHLNSDQLKTLIEDVSTKPDISDLVSEVKQPMLLRQLMAELASFALLKKEWHENEVLSLKKAVLGMKIANENREAFLRAFEILRNISQTIR